MAKKQVVQEEQPAEPQYEADAEHGAAEEPPPAEPQRGLVSMEPIPEVVERVREALEALESFQNAPLPMIRFKEGFTLSEGADEIEEFEGVVIYTKEMNAYYKDRYKAGERKMPDCMSPDGIHPVSTGQVRDKDGKLVPTKTMHHECKTCPMNAFGSSQGGDGKACKNTRPLYILVWNAETKEYGVIPRQLRVPPTSLGLIRAHIMSVAADFGAYFGVRTKFSLFKKSEDQAYYNIKFSYAGRVDRQSMANIRFIREGWMPRLKASTFGIDDLGEAEQPSAPTPGASAERRF
jgi:hypothetical protein